MKTVNALVLTDKDLAPNGHIKQEVYESILQSEFVVFLDKKEPPVVIKNRFGAINVKKAMRLI